MKEKRIHFKCDFMKNQVVVTCHFKSFGTAGYSYGEVRGILVRWLHHHRREEVPGISPLLMAPNRRILRTVGSARWWLLQFLFRIEQLLFKRSGVLPTEKLKVRY